MILEALEAQLRSDKSEDITLNGKLTVEHLMPQKWQAHWPLPAGGSDVEDVREALIHTVGNLTLLTAKLNPAISNGPWGDDGTGKRAVIAKHSALAMNRELNDAKVWDEAAIRGRSRELGEVALRIWPRP